MCGSVGYGNVLLQSFICFRGKRLIIPSLSSLPACPSLGSFPFFRKGGFLIPEAEFYMQDNTACYSKCNFRETKKSVVFGFGFFDEISCDLLPLGGFH